MDEPMLVDVVDDDAAAAASAASPPSPSSSTYVPPSVHRKPLLSGASFTHFSPIPPSLLPPASSSSMSDNVNRDKDDDDDSDSNSRSTTTGPPCALGVDEAGRGPVLGPMVYGVFFLPLALSDPLLRSPAHRFDDSKVLTPAFRSDLMRALCTPGTDLHASCGWATASLSARDIAAGMLRPAAPYNLNAQAMDATVDLIKGVYARGVNVQHIYVDTVGQPAAYQAKLQRVFPTARITVAKKADSLYPCVSAASVCAKVTRDAALEELYRARGGDGNGEDGAASMAWGSGYPSDARCVGWMKNNMHPLFGWGPECRFSWGTAKDMLEAKGNNGIRVEWPLDDDDGETSRLTDFFTAGPADKEINELGAWYGAPAGLEAF
ncbi:Ribonuclease H [Purpureocillium takamizusanense]|uniref:Ribonuclease n=1 Tax=Purpureocillium takamizusanense TaxID=2060973 RepID=A0A9Q8QJ89_9HYPO|nr:Ribonuclease H [Purpureocillium takamizusanense]UNI20186.1 Ribonuclease H [Purpureocillium takamizusanense]